MDLDEARHDPQVWGRLVESAVGAHLVNSSRRTGIDVYYWLSRNQEVDFVLAKGGKLAAIEVKSIQKKTAMPGIEAFAVEFPVRRKLLVGGQGIRLAEFLATERDAWI